jgi:cell division transport system permease protein
MISFIVKEAFKNLLRSRFTGLITGFSMLLTLTLMSIILALAYTVRLKFNELRNQTTVWVYYDQEKDTKNAKSIHEKISQLDYVKKASFVDKESGLKEFYSNNNSDLNSVNEILGYNPLPDASILTIYADKLDSKVLDQLEKKILSFSKRITVYFKKNELEKRAKFIDLLIKAAAFITLIILAITIILIYNTIRLSIHNKQTIIKTMRLVGAKDLYIKWPFILEAIIQSLFASTIVIFLSNYSFTWINENANALIIELGSEIKIYRYHYPILILFGIMIAYIGAKFSIKKYLKFKIKRSK